VAFLGLANPFDELKEEEDGLEDGRPRVWRTRKRAGTKHARMRRDRLGEAAYYREA